MKKILFVFISFCLAGELEVDGDLKVTGTVDASGNPITNVGAPQTLTDAINAGILQSALSDDGVYEYMFIYIRFMGSGSNSNSYERYLMYNIPTDMDTGDSAWSGGGMSKLNDLMLDGWKISARLGSKVGDDGYYIYELRRPIADD